MRTLRIVVLAIVLLLLLVVVRGIGIGYDGPRKREHVEEAGIRRLVALDSNAPIDLVPSSDGSTRILCTETRFVTYDIVRSGDELRVMMRDSRKWYDFLDFHDSGRRLTIYVPESLMDIQLRTSNGSISVEAPGDYDSLDLKSSNGRLSLTGAKIAGIARLETSNAGITIQDAVFGGHLTLGASNGELALANVKLQAAEIDTSNSRISLENVDAAVSLRAATSNGGIYLSGLSTRTGSLTLRTSNGPVEGIISAPQEKFAITSSTSNADNNLPASWEGGPAKLDISTSNGRIRIDFE